MVYIVAVIGSAIATLVGLELLGRIVQVKLAQKAIEEFPKTSEESLESFVNYSEDLGWEAKPSVEQYDVGHARAIPKSSKKNKYRIAADGSRWQKRERFLPKERLIECFGDSATFCRDVKDDETFCFYLENSEKVGVSKNFGVGNYGLDQAYLRAQKKMQGGGVALIYLPMSSLGRVGKVYKHYSEIGNSWAVKPRYKVVSGNNVSLVKKPFSERKNLAILSKYKEWIRQFDDYSPFFLRHFNPSLQFVESGLVWFGKDRARRKFFYDVVAARAGKVLGLRSMRKRRRKKVRAFVSSYSNSVISDYKKNVLDKVFSEKSDEWINLSAKIARAFCYLAVEKNAVPLVVVSSQGKYGKVGRENDYARLSGLLKESCAKEGVCCFDFGSVLNACSVGDRERYRSHKTHLSPEGNAFLACYLAGLVRNRSSSRG